jgi:phosphoribosylamine--glycine ligase
MKFLLVSRAGDGAQILKWIELAGNTVGLHILNKPRRKNWEGLLPHVDNIDDFVDKETIVIFDMSGTGKIADNLRKRGIFVYGASEFADKIEDDREFGLSVMQQAGIKIPETKSFTDFNAGMKFVEANKDKRFVFKPSGDLPCKLTYVSHGHEDLSRYLSFVQAKFAAKIKKFVLQEFIEGIAISTEAFCGGNGFLDPFNHTVEVKKFMNDDIGPSTGCSGNIVWPCDADMIVKDGVGRVEELMRKESYVGQIDLNTVVNDKGVWGLEWTPRMGYDATPTLLALFEQDLGEFFSDIARGQLKKLELEDAFAGGVRVTVPPYPVEAVKGDTEAVAPHSGLPIIGWEDFEEDCYFYEIMLDENEMRVHSGGEGIILCAVGVSPNKVMCIRQCYEVIDAISIPDKQYRTDLADVLPEMVDGVAKYAR